MCDSKTIGSHLKCHSLYTLAILTGIIRSLLWQHWWYMQNDLLCGTGRDEMSANKVGSHRHAIRAKLINNKKVKSFIFCKGTYLLSKINTLLTKIVFFVAVFKTKISFRSVVRCWFFSIAVRQIYNSLIYQFVTRFSSLVVRKVFVVT